MKDAVESNCISEFTAKKEDVSKHRLFEQVYVMPENYEKVID